MPTEKKAKSIDKLETEFSKASIGILTDYRGLKLRKSMHYAVSCRMSVAITRW